MSTPWASAASNEAGVLPGREVGALCPIRLSAGIWTPVCRPVVVALPTEPIFAAARARLPGRAVDDFEVLPACFRAPTRASAAGWRGHRAAPRRRRPRRCAAGSTRPRSSPRPSTGSDPGDDPRSSSVSPIGRWVVLAEPRRKRARRARGRGVRAEHREAAVEALRAAVISLSTGPLNCATSLSSRRIASQAGAGAASRLRAPATCPSSAGASGSTSRLRSDEQALAVRVDGLTACPASFSGQRSRPKRGCGVSIASGTCPASTCRTFRRVVDGVAFRHRAGPSPRPPHPPPRGAPSIPLPIPSRILLPPPPPPPFPFPL